MEVENRKEKNWVEPLTRMGINALLNLARGKCQIG